MAFLFMSKQLQYFITALLIAGGFWFYFQLSTYPYKVARWFQPLESRLALRLSTQCSPGHGWLAGLIDYALVKQGGYSAQVAFIDAKHHLSRCEAGYKNQLFGKAVTADNRYRYASLTKLVTASVIKDLVEQKKLALTDPMVGFFPELTSFKDARIGRITLADLLNHSAGFNRLTARGDSMFLSASAPWCPKHLERLQTLRLDYEPGSRQVYSNLGFCLLGEIVHRVTGQSFSEYINNKYSLRERNIRFINNYFYPDEVTYDYRYENWYDDSYLKQFDFNALASVAGLSGSAKALASLLWDIHHLQQPSPYLLGERASTCKLAKVAGCLQQGLFHFQADNNGLMLHYHDGYLPGSSAIVVIDSFGGVTAIVKSGADKLSGKAEGDWITWIYKRLTLHYTLEGRLPVLEKLLVPTE